MSNFDIVRDVLTGLGSAATYSDTPAGKKVVENCATALAALKAAEVELDAARGEVSWESGRWQAERRQVIIRAEAAEKTNVALESRLKELDKYADLYEAEYEKREAAEDELVAISAALKQANDNTRYQQGLAEAAEADRDRLREALTEMGVDMSAWDAAALRGEVVSAERESLFEALLQEIAVAGIERSVDVEPHGFTPLQKWGNRGRCAACLIHEDHHPAPGWLPARAYGETTEAIRLA
jgi:hypothetical protein